jgi:uncharacterized protein
MTALRTLIISLGIAFAAFAFAPPASAGDPVIDAAIAAGEVGERIDGYLGVVGTTDVATVRKVQEINNLRRSAYQESAGKLGVTVQVVAQATGEKQIAKLETGAFYMDDSGAWQRK